MIQKTIMLLLLLCAATCACLGQGNVFPGSGNVGIGTASPQLKLDIQGGGLSISGRNPIASVNGFTNAIQLKGYSTAAIIHSPGEDTELMFGFSNTGLFYWGSKTNGYSMWLSKAGVLRVYNSIRVGSNAPPGYQLSVEGRIAAKEVTVTLSGWADYVFSPDYRLRPIEEVESFIREHAHLPGIPSASEVEAKGIDLGEMNRLMLEKVEELTLYLIEKEKKEQLIMLEMKDMKKEIDVLKSTMHFTTN